MKKKNRMGRKVAMTAHNQPLATLGSITSADSHVILAECTRNYHTGSILTGELDSFSMIFIELSATRMKTLDGALRFYILVD